MCPPRPYHSRLAAQERAEAEAAERAAKAAKAEEAAAVAQHAVEAAEAVEAKRLEVEAAALRKVAEREAAARAEARR